MIPQKEHGNNQVLKDLILSHPYTIIALLLLSLLGTFFSLVTPLIMGKLIDSVLDGKNVSLLYPLLLGLSVLFLISALSEYISSIVRGNLSLLLFKELAYDIFGAVQESSLEDLQKIKTGDLLTRTMGNTNVAVQTITTIIPQIVMGIIGFILPFMIMFSLNPQLTIIVSSPFVLFVISSVYYGKKVKQFQRQSLDSSAGMNSFLKEAYSIVPLTKVFLLEQWMHDKFAAWMSEYYNASRDVIRVSSMSSSIGMIIYGIPTFLVLIFGSLDVINGIMSVGTFVAFITYTGRFFSPIQSLSLLWTTYKGSQASLDRIGEVLSLKKELWGKKSLVSCLETIEFEDICFSYDRRIIFKNFSATFKNGRNYLVGDNGSGKSTIIRLLCGLYRPDRGTILIDGQDLSSLSRESLRKSVSVVFSDALIFDGTISENILIGDRSASREDMMNAAKKAQLHEFVLGLPGQYETEVGESGLNLSSGEKQKIALARVILRDSPIVIFDEFTRSIDIESKKSILSVIRKMDNKIIIIITHDSDEIENNCNLVGIEKVNISPIMDDNRGENTSSALLTDSPVAL